MQASGRNPGFSDGSKNRLPPRTRIALALHAGYEPICLFAHNIEITRAKASTQLVARMQAAGRNPGFSGESKNRLPPGTRIALALHAGYRLQTNNQGLARITRCTQAAKDKPAASTSCCAIAPMRRSACGCSGPQRPPTLRRRQFLKREPAVNMVPGAMQMFSARQAS